ncbi:MAG: tetratricopeptide repeat protein [Edaphobacter sp.]
MSSFLRLILTAVLVSTPYAFAQTEPFSLPIHHGAMLLDLSGFNVVQSSAKPGGAELGLRVHDQGNTTALLFLFLTPENTHGTPASCRQAELEQIKKGMGANLIDAKLDPSGKDNNSIATMLITEKNGQHLYGFRGADDQCLSMEVYSDPRTTLDLSKASSFLARQKYDANYVPSGKDKFIYAEVLYRSQQYKAAAPIYLDFLKSLPNNPSNLMQRRIATDNMGMALGMSGDVDGARKVFEEAVRSDPDYPLNYYNLACADAEQGKAIDAKIHLQQAFDRKANTIKGEQMPDPTKDDSILKLRSDKNFWAFVQTLK